MKLKNKNVLVYGMSSSGEWVSKLLLKYKANVYLYDDNLDRLRNKNISNCYLVNELKDEMLEEMDFLVVSPAIEKDNKYLELAKNIGKRVYSEVEFASLFCSKLVAVTGTNGKTTTVELIARLLSKKHKAVACGNNGYPLSRAVLEKRNYIKVVEVSSFMLENAEEFAPHVSTILNIEPDHLIRHKTMEEYTNLKMNIFANLTTKDYAVINLDSKIHPIHDHMTITYSFKRLADVYVKNGYIYLHQYKIIAIKDLKLKGKHNVENVMCAICYAYIYRVLPNKIREALLEYVPEPYRIEKVATINGIHFVNDSKSTNIASTIASVDTIKGSSILLLGGSKKGLDYTKLFTKLSKRVKKIFVFGEIAKELIEQNTDFDVTGCDNLSMAFDLAVSGAKSNDTILLSPASASYDQFTSYVERGRAFNAKVSEYETENKKK